MLKNCNFLSIRILSIKSKIKNYNEFWNITERLTSKIAGRLSTLGAQPSTCGLYKFGVRDSYLTDYRPLQVSETISIHRLIPSNVYSICRHGVACIRLEIADGAYVIFPGRIFRAIRSTLVNSILPCCS